MRLCLLRLSRTRRRLSSLRWLTIRRAANKPDAIKEKMATGRLGKFYKENCLVDQAFIKDGNMDVNAYVNATAKKLGGDIKIVEYTHFIKGEGLEKRVDDFAAEVAAAVKG